MWMDIVGHDQIVARFEHAVREGRLATTYLFVGPGGVGKRLFARRLAECLFCSQSDDTVLQACGECESCHLMRAGNHPDLHEIDLPIDEKTKQKKRTLLLRQFVGDREHRNREGLCHDIALKPFLASRRVAVIDHADTLNEETANALLKTLEEPPPHSLLILLGTSETRQLPTIRSRAQIMRFAPLQPAQIERILLEQQLVPNAAVAKTVAELTDGGLDQAMAMAGEELWNVHTSAVEILGRPVIDSVRLADMVHQYTNSAGKDAAPRRTALAAVLNLVARHYRRQMRADPHSPHALRVVRRLDRCLEAEYQVDRNAHLQTVIQAWANDLART